MFSNFFPENLAVYEIVWNSRQATDEDIIRRMRMLEA
jgi:hypothetical protein